MSASPPLPRPDWSGALLLGGESRRMGRAKTRLPLPDGSALAERPADALRATCGRCFAVHAPARRPYLPAGFEPLADAVDGAGPIGGLLAALERAETPWVLVLAADLPEVDARLLAALQEHAGGEPFRALLPLAGDRVQPLAAAYPAALAPLVRHAVEAGERAAVRALPERRVRLWREALWSRHAHAQQPFRNLNTPEDWRAYTGVPAAR